MTKHWILAGLLIGVTLSGCQEQTSEQEQGQDQDQEEQEEQRETEWTYESDTGPEEWGSLDPSYQTCADGNEQSPVDIEFSEVTESSARENVELNYQPGKFNLSNDGHTLMVHAARPENVLSIEEDNYKLVQFHFHTPSEHQFNGEYYEMELHLVHENQQGELAVAGIMIQQGAENETLLPIWNKLPEKETESSIPVENLIDVQALLPEDADSFHYNGSLTTPPCSEQVKWMIYEEPITMSAEQIEQFQHIFGENHRPVQPLNDREIELSSSNE